MSFSVRSGYLLPHDYTVKYGAATLVNINSTQWFGFLFFIFSNLIDIYAAYTLLWTGVLITRINGVLPLSTLFYKSYMTDRSLFYPSRGDWKVAQGVQVWKHKNVACTQSPAWGLCLVKRKRPSPAWREKDSKPQYAMRNFREDAGSGVKWRRLADANFRPTRSFNEQLSEAIAGDADVAFHQDTGAAAHAGFGGSPLAIF